MNLQIEKEKLKEYSSKIKSQAAAILWLLGATVAPFLIGIGVLALVFCTAENPAGTAPEGAFQPVCRTAQKACVKYLQPAFGRSSVPTGGRYPCRDYSRSQRKFRCRRCHSFGFEAILHDLQAPSFQLPSDHPIKSVVTFLKL